MFLEQVEDSIDDDVLIEMLWEGMIGYMAMILNHANKIWLLEYAMSQTIGSPSN